MKKTILKSSSFLLCCVCICWFQIPQISRFFSEDITDSQKTALISTQRKEDSLQLNSQLPRFGFGNVHANLTFLSFLEYFGDEQMRKQSGYGLSSKFFQSIISDDPYYREFYVFLTNSVSLSAGQPEKSVELMKKGLASLSPQKPEGSYYIWRYKGVEELLFIGDSKAAEDSFRTAAEWARGSILPESELIASISEQTAHFLMQNPDSKAAQIGAWSSILTTAVDDETRGRAIRSIESLGGEVTVNENGGVTVQYAQGDRDSES